MSKNRKYPPQKRKSKKLQKQKQMVDGNNYLTKVERMVKAGASYGSTISSIASTVGGLVRMINTENKYLDTYNLQQPGTTALFTCLTAVAQGTDDNQRIGNSIKPQNMTVKLLINHNESNSTSISTRVIVFVDKENDGADPTGTGMLLENTTTAQAQIISPINKDYSKRFVILKDKVLSTSNVGPKVLKFKFFSPIDFHTYYDGTGSAVANFKENQIYLMLISDDNVNKPLVYQYTRLNFTDN